MAARTKRKPARKSAKKTAKKKPARKPAKKKAAAKKPAKAEPPPPQKLRENPQPKGAKVDIPALRRSIIDGWSRGDNPQRIIERFEKSTGFDIPEAVEKVIRDKFSRGLTGAAICDAIEPLLT